MTCSLPECSKPGATKGLCDTHYRQVLRGKDPRIVPGPRYPFDVIDRMFPGPVKTGGRFKVDEGVTLVHDAVGVSRHTVYRWRKDGMTTGQADRVAVRLGLNPVDLWPSWYDDAELEPTCAMCEEKVSEERKTCSEECRRALRNTHLHKRRVAA